MADAATISVTATMLPDEIAKTITGAMTVTPADTTEKWYYKLTSVSAASTDLMAGSFLDYTAVDDDTAPTAVHTADTVKFLFIQNTHATTSVYINITTSGTAAAAAKLVEISNAKVASFIFVINLFDLSGSDNLVKNNYKVENLIDFPGH